MPTLSEIHSVLEIEGASQQVEWQGKQVNSEADEINSVTAKQDEQSLHILDCLPVYHESRSLHQSETATLHLSHDSSVARLVVC